MIYLPQVVNYDKVARIAELNVIDACHLSAPNGWKHKERFLDVSELIYVTSGSLTLSVNKSKIELSAGDIYIIRQYTLLSGGYSTDRVGFYSVSFSSTIEKYKELYHKVIRVTDRSSYLETLFNNLNYHSTGKTGNSHLLDASFLMLLETLFTSQQKEPERVQMNSILAYINNQIATPLTMEQISEHFHYSGDHIARLFKDQFRMTIKQYIIEKKLSVAKRLLVTSTLPIKLIGETVGFEDKVLFEKFFKYHIKLTPKKYRALYM